MSRLIVTGSLLAALFNCAQTSELTAPLNEVVRRGDGEDKVLLVGDLFSEFEANAALINHGSASEFSDIHPDVTLADLGSLSLVTVQKPSDVDYRIFRGAKIIALQIMSRPCTDYSDPTGPRLGLGTCDFPGDAVLSADQLRDLATAEQLDSIALHLPYQQINDEFISVLSALVETHNPTSIGYGFAIPFCDIASVPETHGLGISLDNQPPETLELLTRAAGGSAIFDTDLINAAREQGIDATDDVTAIISQTRNTISFKNEGVAALRALQQETCP